MEVASRSMQPPEGHVRASSRALALALALLIFLFASLAQAFAARLGGAYYVDDAEIGKPGSCEIESWSSFAANGDRIAVFSPACVVNPGRPVEVGTNLYRVPVILTLGRFPKARESDSTWRTKEVRHVGSDIVAP
jgi:hypothetical protein